MPESYEEEGLLWNLESQGRGDQKIVEDRYQALKSIHQLTVRTAVTP